MIGWKHAAIAPWTHKSCGEHIATRKGIDVLCGCYDPKPDMESPCGFEGCWMSGRDCHCDDPAEGCAGGHPITSGGHPFVPTLCHGCGHRIEAERAA